jgi:hypothetical protein
MSKLLSAAAAIVFLGSAPALAANYHDYHPWAETHAAATARYAGPVSLHGYYAHGGFAGPVYGYQPQQSMTPEFNNPGAQLSVPYTGNAVDQLSPLMGAGQPDALGIK